MDDDDCDWGTLLAVDVWLTMDEYSDDEDDAESEDEDDCNKVRGLQSDGPRSELWSEDNSDDEDDDDVVVPEITGGFVVVMMDGAIVGADTQSGPDLFDCFSSVDLRSDEFSSWLSKGPKS